MSTLHTCDFCNKVCKAARTLKQHQLACPQKRASDKEKYEQSIKSKATKPLEEALCEKDQKISELQSRIQFLLERNLFLEDTLQKVSDSLKTATKIVADFETKN